MHVTWGESEETLSPGTKLSVSPGDDRLKEGRMTITLEDPQKEIHPEYQAGAGNAVVFRQLRVERGVGWAASDQ